MRKLKAYEYAFSSCAFYDVFCDAFLCVSYAFFQARAEMSLLVFLMDQVLVALS